MTHNIPQELVLDYITMFSVITLGWPKFHAPYFKMQPLSTPQLATTLPIVVPILTKA